MKRARIFIPSQETIAETKPYYGLQPNSNINCANYPKYVTFKFYGFFFDILRQV